MMALDAELKVFNDNRDAWLKHHANKFVLVKENEIAGFFDSAETAFVEGIERWGNVSLILPYEPPSVVGAARVAAGGTWVSGRRCVSVCGTSR